MNQRNRQNSPTSNPMDTLIGVGITLAQLQESIDLRHKADQKRPAEDQTKPKLEDFTKAVQERDLVFLRDLIFRCDGTLPEGDHRKLLEVALDKFDSKIMTEIHQAKIHWGAVKPYLTQVLKKDDAAAFEWLLENLPPIRKYLNIQPYEAQRKGEVPSGDRMYDRGRRVSFWGADEQRTLWTTKDVYVREEDPENGIDADHEDPVCVMAHGLDGLGPNCLQYMVLHMPALAWVLDQCGSNPSWIDQRIWKNDVYNYSGVDAMRSREAGRDHIAGALAQGGFWIPEKNADLNFWTQVPLYKALLNTGTINLYVSLITDVEAGILGLTDLFGKFTDGAQWLSKALIHEIQTDKTNYENIWDSSFRETKNDTGAIRPEVIGPADRPIIDSNTQVPFRSRGPAKNLLDLMILTGTPTQMNHILTSPLLAPSIWKRMADDDGISFILTVMKRHNLDFYKEILKDPNIQSWRDINGNNVMHWIVRDTAKRIRDVEKIKEWRNFNSSGPEEDEFTGSNDFAFKRLAKLAPELMSETNNFNQRPTVFLKPEIQASVDRYILCDGAAVRPKRRSNHRKL